MRNYNCKNCGAELYWDTQVGCLKCQFCESEYKITDFDDHTNTDIEVKDESLDKEYTGASDASDEMSVYACKNCGGEVVALSTTMATICPYCSEAISITSKSVGAFRPDICIPFKNNKKQAIKIYSDYVNKSLLTPKAFKEQYTIEKIQGLFTPFHLHTMRDRASHVFEGERTSFRRRGYDRVTTHNVFHLKIDANGNFERIPTDASTRISNKLMDSIEPFGYDELKEYNPAYMAGFVAEQMDDDENDMKMRAEVRAKSTMQERARNSFVGYNGIKMLDEDNKVYEHSTVYAMLPVWLLNVNHNGQKYTFAVNGQTGKVVGKLPMDKVKLAAIGLGSFIVSDIAIAILSLIFS